MKTSLNIYNDTLLSNQLNHTKILKEKEHQRMKYQTSSSGSIITTLSVTVILRLCACRSEHKWR